MSAGVCVGVSSLACCNVGVSLFGVPFGVSSSACPFFFLAWLFFGGRVFFGVFLYWHVLILTCVFRR